ncbi:hypothetical protein Y024_5784 [Burkholderia pseudomallei TSV44]|nr:hypothetical protein Y024_5784 [Burkholderia pseudomallei TSV44]
MCWAVVQRPSRHLNRYACEGQDIRRCLISTTRRQRKRA